MEKESLVADAGPSRYLVTSMLDSLAEFRNIPFYTNNLKYPWEEDEEEIKANEYDGIDYNKVSSKPWPSMPYRSSKRRGGRGSNSVDPQHGKWPHRKKVDSPQPLLTSEEVLRVRLDMYNLKESQNSEESLFNCLTSKEELKVNFPHTMTYYYHSIRDGLKAKSYPHFFHQFVGKFSSPCCNYIEPTTLEGDLQYIDFFDKLMESARYRETKDGVLAKAIVIANKFFQKMLFFQIRIAVDEYLQLMHHLEKMAQRHKLYYYIVHEELIEKKERKAIFKHIQEGRVRLFYDLTEFAALELEDCEYTVQDTVERLKELTGGKSPPKKSIKDGTYKRRICNEIDKLFPREIELYTSFLKQKMKTAEEHNVIPKGTCERFRSLSNFESREKELELSMCVTCYFSVKGFVYDTAEGT
ncbi:hypothetical protein CFC21_016934 [Triticum aestivum]|uniref:Uncharacterized protein n=2 Tax=Triticum aestivum TaxID=4565 RepID=A0A1D5TD42_WHEAT|nr:uncharacterized protein LOC119354674 [Triticum dicoccoides]XP_037477322.1 uncharacterized protein LOC119354674 [Triticum dicoccoides]XP_044446399.1 uncharacterized protein LOC123176075 isoform X1 [Triticum aestivum]XP_044457027.1 uncharacterized protein LOC123188811 isoform X1 [Triticum aestivum]XP_044457028.1 uncharacterized protein LOC123188811 isoform X1 [Triticum aestivum]XP_044457031.1 uncharacterized protein LOC123188814 isoform X1 [Triticum aestivum]XP_044457032.1 uncharacterized pr